MLMRTNPEQYEHLNDLNQKFFDEQKAHCDRDDRTEELKCFERLFEYWSETIYGGGDIDIQDISDKMIEYSYDGLNSVLLLEG